MSQIKCIVQSAKCKVNEAGFSFMEMLIVVSLLGAVAVIASGFLIASLGGSSRAEISKEVRQNGNYALSVMEGLILSSKSVSCPSTTQINMTDLNSDTAMLVCDVNNQKISSGSATRPTVDLTGDNVAVSACDFTCDVSAGRPSKVSIDFTVSQKTASQRPSERSSMRFQTDVMTKNY